MRKMRLAAAGALAAMAMLAGCGAGHDAEQLVKKDPATVSSAFANAFSQGAMNGAQQYSNLWNGGFQILVDKKGEKTLDVVTKFDGATSTETHFTFTPRDDGQTTLVDADVKVDTAVMHKAFAGTPQERLANLPEAAFISGMQRTMVKYAQRIELGTPLNLASEGWQTSGSEPPPEFYEGMSAEDRAEIRRHDEEEHQQAIGAPMVDPDADAKKYLKGGQ